jgi:hypothetical protein
MSFTYLDAEEYYNKLQEWVPLATPSPGQFWTNIVNHHLSKVDNKQMKYDKCLLDYDSTMLEKRALSISIFLISWALFNFSKKTNDGHCRNISHLHGDRHPRKCKDGSEFHMALYNDYLKSFKEILEAFESSPPKLITEEAT